MLPKDAPQGAADIWQGCVMAALVLLLLDITARRVIIRVPEVVKALGRRWQWARRLPSPVAPPERTQRLFTAKQRARRGRGEPVPTGASQPSAETPQEIGKAPWGNPTAGKQNGGAIAPRQAPPQNG